MTAKEHSRKLDQFYTNPTYARSFVDKINTLLPLKQFDLFLEPSAGTGNFYSLLDPDHRIGLDLDPKCKGIIKTDFFDWVSPLDKKIITIGNPPFGKNASLAVKFFNQAARFSEAIAFVIPKTFRKTSLINRLNKKFHKIYDVDVPAFSFIFNNTPYDVWCCAQIWVRRDQDRPTISTFKFDQVKSWFEIVDPKDADFSIQRVGGRAGMIRTEEFDSYSKTSHYFIKSHVHGVLDIFQQIDFNHVKFNTAGNPSVSSSELIELWLNQAALNGMHCDHINNTEHIAYFK